MSIGKRQSMHITCLASPLALFKPSDFKDAGKGNIYNSPQNFDLKAELTKCKTTDDLTGKMVFFIFKFEIKKGFIYNSDGNRKAS